MASVQEVIASFDLEKIKGRRAAWKRMLSILKKQLETKLAKTGADPDEFDHAKIPRNKVLDDFSSVRKYLKDFEELDCAWLSCRHEDEDEEEEKKFSYYEFAYYNEVVSVARELLELSDQYEESYQYEYEYQCECRLHLMLSAKLKYDADQEGRDDFVAATSQDFQLLTRGMA